MADDPHAVSGPGSDAVLYERRGRTALLTINRPDRRNAVDPEVSRLMNHYVEVFEEDPELWVGVVTGAGEVAFSAGADLKAIAAGQMEAITEVEPFGFAGLIRGKRTKPMIAAVNGAALAGGCEIVLACDLAVAGHHASFGLPEVRRGIIAGAGGLQRLPRLIPPRWAMDLILTGRTIDATEALEYGMINEVVDADLVLARTLEIAAAIGSNAPIAVRESRAVAHAAIAGGESDAWERSEVAWERVLASEDSREGPRAFAERRSPTWKGC